MVPMNKSPKYQIYQKPAAPKTVTGNVVLWIGILFMQLSTMNASYVIKDFPDLSSKFFNEYGCIEGELVVTSTDPVYTSNAAPNPSGEKSKEFNAEKCYVVPTSTEPVAHNKEKTPMCLINELARYNSIQHEYRLTDESGLAHKKVFNVTLKLGDEEYSAQGTRIKQAQHAAAEIALSQTKYKSPIPKAKQNIRPKTNEVTPIFELNSLAMKRREPTVYQFIDAPKTQYNHCPKRPVPSMYWTNRCGNNKQGGPRRFRYNRDPTAFSVSVKVGEREYIGTGPTSTAAKRAAAVKALEELRNLPIDNKKSEFKPSVNGNEVKEVDPASELKSPISLVYELALKRNLVVKFNVIDEKGPPHMRIFVTECLVGDDFRTLGEGNSKKTSKKKAAEKMLLELKALPITTTINPAGFTMRPKIHSTKKKRNLIKEGQTVSQDNFEMNPVSKLMQLQQSRKERDPVYILKGERPYGSFKREFQMEVQIGDTSEIGIGPTKKIAKRNAAKRLLQKLGQVSNSPIRSIKNGDNKKVQFNDLQDSQGTTNSKNSNSGGRQLAPGLLLVPSEGTSSTNPKSPNSIKSNNSKQSLRNLAQEYLYKTSDADESQNIRPKDKLISISRLLGFNVQFTDFNKGSQNDVLSLVSLSTDPPQVCHGHAATPESSHDLAAANALKTLAELGIDSILPSKKETPMGPDGENMYNLVSESGVPYVNGRTPK